MDICMDFQATFVFFLFLVAPMVNVDAAAGDFNVKNYGAVSDGKTDSTKAFLSTWKEACAWEGKAARVLIPEGAFLVGPLDFQGPCKAPIVLQVQGAVLAPADLSLFPSDAWVSFDNVDGLNITGSGKFDGQGAMAWPNNQCPKKKNCKVLPTSIKFSYVSNAYVGGITSVDSKFFHMIIFESKNINLDMLKITAPGNSPNTDGIHIGDSSNVKITQSTIGTGDDCISIGPGSTNISISEVFCGPGHGISIGSLGKYQNENDVAGVSVINCTLTGTTNGLRIKTWQDSPVSAAHDFTFEDVVMNHVYNPIIIDQEYCPFTSCDEKSPSRVKISNVNFRNIRGVSATKVAVKLTCSRAVPCQGVKLSNIDLVYNSQQGEAAASTCSNVQGSSSGLLIPSLCL